MPMRPRCNRFKVQDDRVFNGCVFPTLEYQEEREIATRRFALAFPNK